MKNDNKTFFKRIIFVLIILLGIIVTVTSFAGCMNQDDSKKIIAIRITSEPYKTSYNVGDALNISGLVVYNVYEDGSEDYTEDYTVTPPAGTILNETGSQTVTVEKIITKIRRKDIHQATFTIQVN